MTHLRSWMFVPGSEKKRIDKVRSMPVDAIIYDLEDSVSVYGKETARKLVKEAISSYRVKPNIVRINALNTTFFQDDLLAISVQGLSGIMLPKAESREDICHLDRLLTQLEAERQIAERSIEIIPLVESAMGLYRAYEIATSTQRVKRLAFGSIDFTFDIHAELSKEGLEILFARSQLVLLSRAADIEPPIDAVYMHIHDDSGLRKDTQFAKQLGFQGKLIVHPNQIGIVNEVFTPSQLELEDAMAIISAYEEAASAGSGVFQLNGKMIDYPVLKRAQRIVQQSSSLDNGFF